MGKFRKCHRCHRVKPPPDCVAIARDRAPHEVAVEARRSMACRPLRQCAMHGAGGGAQTMLPTSPTMPRMSVSLPTSTVCSGQRPREGPRQTPSPSCFRPSVANRAMLLLIGNPVPRQKLLNPVLRCVTDTTEHMVTEAFGSTSIFPWCRSHQNFVRMYSTPRENACLNSAPSSYASLNPDSAAATLSSGVP